MKYKKVKIDVEKNNLEAINRISYKTFVKLN